MDEHIGLVVLIARQYSAARSREMFQDLVQEGCMAVAHAKTLYNPAFGTKFSSYAAYWIRGYMSNYIRKNTRELPIETVNDQVSMVHSPEITVMTYEIASKARDFSLELSDRDKRIFEAMLNGDEASTDIAKELGVSRQRIHQLESKLRKQFRPLVDFTQVS